MPFPRDRFVRAGADAHQLQALEEQYDALSQQAQESYDARLAPLSDAAIADEYLSEPAAVEPDEEPEAVSPSSIPTVSSSSSSVPSAASSGSSDSDSDE